MLLEKLKDKKIILGSKSPRRSELLRGAGIDFVCTDSCQADETFPPDMPSEEVPLYLAGKKSDSYPGSLGRDEILITADTVVIIDGRILGKPGSRTEAIGMLSDLSGREHTVITGVMIRGNLGRHGFSVSTGVRFRPLDVDEIVYYVNHYRPYDKAGSYGIQEWIGYVGIENVDGSFYNVMGLPIQSLYVNLRDFIL